MFRILTVVYQVRWRSLRLCCRRVKSSGKWLCVVSFLDNEGITSSETSETARPMTCYQVTKYLNFHGVSYLEIIKGKKKKDKFRPITSHEGPEGEYRYRSTFSLTSALDRNGWLTSLPGRFTCRNETRCPFYRRLGGPQGRSGRVRKISSPQGFDPRTVQPTAIHCINWAIPCPPMEKLILRKLSCVFLLKAHTTFRRWNPSPSSS